MLTAVFVSMKAYAQNIELLYSSQPSVTPALAVNGQFDVGVRTIKAVNPTQLNTDDFISIADRSLTLEAWYPAIAKKDSELAVYRDQTRSGKQFALQGNAYRNATINHEEKYPLVVISHGYTGYRTMMFYLGEHLASHGYVVVGIDHTDSTNKDINFGNNPSAGFASTLFNRALDQQFVLNYFSSNKPLGTAIDTNLAGLIGYSMGGYGGLNTFGACFDFTDKKLARFGFNDSQIEHVKPLLNYCSAKRNNSDSRWQAGILYAPWGGELNIHTTDSLANITAPILFITGDQDDVSGFENGTKKLFQQSNNQDKFLMVYENARHNIAAHPTPTAAFTNDLDIGHYFEPSWNIETINRINKHINLAFLNCYLKAEKQDCEFLPESDNITQTKQVDNSFSKAWPGFANRWGTGVRFYRK